MKPQVLPVAMVGIGSVVAGACVALLMTNGDSGTAVVVGTRSVDPVAVINAVIALISTGGSIWGIAKLLFPQQSGVIDRLKKRFPWNIEPSDNPFFDNIASMIKLFKPTVDAGKLAFDVPVKDAVYLVTVEKKPKVEAAK